MFKGYLTKSGYITKIKNSCKLCTNNSYIFKIEKKLDVTNIFWFKVEA